MKVYYYNRNYGDFMKVLMKPIEMIAWFTQDGLPTPVRFRMEQPNGSYIVIKVARTIARQEEKLTAYDNIYLSEHCPWNGKAL